MQSAIQWLTLAKEGLHGVPVPGLQGAVSVLLEVVLMFDVSNIAGAIKLNDTSCYVESACE